MVDSRVRRLKISSNVVTRLVKDKKSYEDEVKQLIKSVEDKDSSHADEYEIKKTKSLLDESKMMVNDCKTRLTKAISELDNLIEECGDLSETKEFKDAKSTSDSAAQ